jgi:hypothetical protein
MSAMTMDRPSCWLDGRMSDEELADALGCDIACVHGVTECWSRNSLSKLPADRTQGVQTCVWMAIAHALHTTGAMTLADAAAVAAGSWQVSASLMKLLEFRPRDCPPAEGEGEADPLMQFVPHAAEAIPIAAVDEYLDVADGRRVYWRSRGATHTCLPAISTACHAQADAKTHPRSRKSTLNYSPGCGSLRTMSASGSGLSLTAVSVQLPTGSPSARPQCGRGSAMQGTDRSPSHTRRRFPSTCRWRRAR